MKIKWNFSAKQFFLSTFFIAEIFSYSFVQAIFFNFFLYNLSVDC